MKKFVIAACVLVVASSVASAAVGIAWTVNYGAYSWDAPNTTGWATPADEATALLNNNSAIWQLIYAGADNIANPIPDPAAAAPGIDGGTGFYQVYGDDVVWGERIMAQSVGNANVIASDGNEFDFWMASANLGNSLNYVDLGWSTAGFVYQRVFQGTPANDSYFFETPMQALVTTYTPSGGPELFAVDAAGMGAAGFQTDQQINVVPEPATMSLLGLGALVMAIRRRRK